jgi:hypothetical protein
MATEENPTRIPAVTSVAGLAWLLFMQPLRLHYIFRSWGLSGDPPLIDLWPGIRERDPVIVALLGRLAVLLFLVMPAMAFGSAALLQLAGFSVIWLGVSFCVAIGVALGVAFGVWFGVVGSVASGVAFGVALGVAIFLSFGVGLGVAAGVSAGVVVGVARGVASGVARGVASGVGVGVVVGVSFGAAVDLALGVWIGVSFGVAFVLSYLRLPLFPLEALTTTLLSLAARLFPARTPSFARFLPFRLHDLIYLPLPGLHSFLLTAAETNPDLARTLIAEAAVYPAQKGIAARASADLQAKDLERAAQARLFARAAALDFPFLPAENTLEESSPLHLFQSAAKDLAAGESDQRQRRLALDRARKTLEGFITRTASASKPDSLAKRLLPTARLWLDVIQDEHHRLAAETIKNPQVPRAFIAGPPLSPERIEDQPLFKGRTDLAKIIAHDLDPDRRGVLVVIGQRRMGKSSLRNWLPRLLGTGTLVLPADFQSLSGHPLREHPHRWLVDLIAAHLPSAPPPPASNAWGESLDWLRGRDNEPSLGDCRILVVIDEVERVEDGIRAGWCSTDFLDFLRAAGDSLRRIRFLLLTAYPLHRLGPHWVDRLISATTRSLTYLDERSAEELVRAPIPDFPDIYPDGGVERILFETHRHPFLVQKTCDELCKYLNEHSGRRKATSDEVDTVLDTVIEEKLFDELWAQRSADEQGALRALASASAPLRADTPMRALAREGLVELIGDHATLAVPLFGAWIRLTQGA